MNNFLAYFSGVVIFLLLTSCGKSVPSAAIQTEGARIDTKLYEVRDVVSSDWKHVSRNHSNGEIFEEGYVLNGKKEGTWTSYYPTDGYIQNVATYSNGVLMGPFMEFDERGRLAKHSNYENNVLTGQYAEFKNGRAERKMQYRNGLINGYVRDFNTKSKITKEANYKDNVLHGNVIHYNEDGKIVMKYEYKDGKKVSGGIVE